MVKTKAASCPTMFRRIYHGCSRCNHILERSQWLLEPKDWKLQKLGSGGNGEVYRARCPETGCEHAAKFLPYSSGRWECDVTERVQKDASRHILKAICSGISKHPAGGASDSVPQIVLLLELMSEDLFEAVFTPSAISVRMLNKNCALKHVAYQLLEAVRGQYQFQSPVSDARSLTRVVDSHSRSWRHPRRCENGEPHGEVLAGVWHPEAR